MPLRPFKFSSRMLCCLGLIFVAGCLTVFAQTAKPEPAQTAKPSTTQPAPAAPPVLQSATQPSQPPLFPKDMVIMTIGDRKYTVEDFNRVMEVFSPQQRAYYNGPGRRKFADDFSQLLILSDEARRQKVDGDPLVQEQILLLTDQTLARTLIDRLKDQAKVSDADIEKYYNDHIKQYEEIRARHILIRPKSSPAPLPAGKKELTDEEAQAKAEEVYKEVTAPGADFAAIAKQESYDQGSAAKGGDLGTFRRGQMVPEFEAAAFALNPGEISKPIRTQFGFHIIRIDEKKTRSLEEAKSEIETQLRQQKLTEAVDALKKSVKVDLNPQFFPSPTPPAPAPTTPPAAEKK